MIPKLYKLLKEIKTKKKKKSSGNVGLKLKGSSQ